MDFTERQTLRRTLREMAEPLVEELGCTLIAIQLTGDRTGPIVRLFLDRPGGVRVADCTRVSRQLSLELDVEDPMVSAYRLEVSSPGMERPVELPEDFARFAGYRAKVRMAPDWGRRRYKGVLKGLEGDNVLLDGGREVYTLPLGRIDRAHLELSLEEFSRFGDPLVDSQPDAGADR